MQSVINLDKVFPYHDLMIEIGRIELALECTKGHSDGERRPRLESHMKRLQRELDSLAA